MCTCGRRRGGTRTAARSATCSWPTTCGTRPRSGRGCRSSTTSAGRSPGPGRRCERLVASVARHLEPGKARAIAAEGLEFAESRPLGGTWVLDALWERLGIGPAMRDLLKGRRLDPSAERVLFALTANRALAPSSKLAAARWASEDVLITGLPATSDDACYRAMDWLLEIRGALEKAVFDRACRAARPRDRPAVLRHHQHVLRDGGGRRPVRPRRARQPGPGRRRRRRGSSGRRGSGPGASPRTTATTCPRSSSAWPSPATASRCACGAGPGTPADSALIRQVKDDLRGWSLSRVVWVADRGFTSAENRRYLRKGGNHYIIGERLRSGSAEAGRRPVPAGPLPGSRRRTCGSRKSGSPRTSGSSSATAPKAPSGTPRSAPA